MPMRRPKSKKSGAPASPSVGSSFCPCSPGAFRTTCEWATALGVAVQRVDGSEEYDRSGFMDGETNNEMNKDAWRGGW